MKTNFAPTTNIIDDDQLELVQGGWAFGAGRLLGEYLGSKVIEQSGFSFKKHLENAH